LTAVYRIGYCPSPAPAPDVLLTGLGHGSTLGNGRWHTKGPLQVVYCGATRALCQLEKRVHANGANPRDQALMRLEVPDSASLVDVATLGLPGNWRDDEAATQTIGNAWMASAASLGLWVPSYIEPGERNLLLNPAHPDYAAIVLHIERHPFRFDPRLFLPR
jgi:RES domain-containing protein